MGTVDVWRVPHDMREEPLRDLIRHLQGKRPRALQ
jgi:hypothetical protein